MMAGMDLPVMPPVKPMLAKPATWEQLEAVYERGQNLHHEPKWDGFRCVVFRDGDEVELGSRNERPLTRYFPEVVQAVLDQLPDRCVVDGEIVIADPARGALDFEALLQRIHPAESRVRRLAAQTPASFVAFDLLAVDDVDLTAAGFGQRRARLEAAMSSSRPPVHLTPATTDRALAREWFDAFEGAGLDGVVAKATDLPYRQNERVMHKLKHLRTADCVVAGFRWHTSGPVVGSLLLGLYDTDGGLQHVGVCGAFTAVRRRELVEELAAYRLEDLTGHPWQEWAEHDAARAPERRPGAVSRWNAGKDLSWQPLRPELVCEVSYDHMEGTRFRHTAQFRHWRTDRAPASCTFDQLDTPVGFDLADVLGGAG
jgi:ATP-dependent DNA ligase